jgi:hypothetical protein
MIACWPLSSSATTHNQSAEPATSVVRNRQQKADRRADQKSVDLEVIQHRNRASGSHIEDIRRRPDGSNATSSNEHDSGGGDDERGESKTEHEWQSGNEIRTFCTLWGRAKIRVCQSPLVRRAPFAYSTSSCFECSPALCKNWLGHSRIVSSSRFQEIA